MSRKETPRAAHGSASRFSGAFTPGRIAMIAVAVLTLVFIFENTGEVKIRLLIPEVTMPLYVALLATALLGAACGYYVAARRRK
ncbi:lipopolysaccharide assembly protein LapA domain-containing protein [Streptomyces sp. NPDC056361]|uniref:lipopolysaccharide assembly protein LapA domain-containing protein n=1 Tax=Streptomyces sp. NPDC056361 TaxID=3345795 RepID=UPI0035D94B4B